MKNRDGFVSNSSSSSFVIMGKRLYSSNEKEILDVLKTGKLVAVGKYLYNGTDIFYLDESFENSIKNYFKNRSEDLEFLQEIVPSDEPTKKELMESLVSLDDNDKVEIMGYDRDNFSTDNVKDFEERYIMGDKS